MTTTQQFVVRKSQVRWLVVAALMLAAASLELRGAIPGAGEPVKVFIFAGQSNMVGADAKVDEVDGFPPFVGAMRPVKGVRYAYAIGDARSDGWTELAPVGQSFGPELTFVRKVQPLLESPIAVIKCAVGGTTIADDWNPNATEGRQLFRRAIDLIENSLEDLRRRRKEFELEAVFWHQGENDMLNGELRGQYAAGLTTLIQSFRDELDAPQLRWFIGEISDKGIWGMDHRAPMRILREQQRQVVAADPGVWWVPTSHLAFEVMASGQPHYHFGTLGQLQHGEAYAEAYLNVMGLQPEVSPVALRRGLPGTAEQPLRVFVLAGQRNMEGEGAYVDEIGRSARHAALGKPQESILFRCMLGGDVYVSADWEPLRPVGLWAGFGPELSFGRKLDKALRDGVVVLKVTDSAALMSDWSPSEEDANRPRFHRAMEFIRQALADLKESGRPVTVEGVFWHHGENDTFYAPFRNRYAIGLEGVIAGFRAELNEPELKWFLVLHSDRGPWGAERIGEMNQHLRGVAEADPLVHLVDSSSLSHDRITLGTRGTLQLGEALAEAYLER